MPPVAFNHYLPPTTPRQAATELGFSLSGYWANNGNQVRFVTIPVWYRKNLFRYLDVGARGYFSIPSWLMVGPELAIGQAPIKIIFGAYPVHLFLSEEPRIVPLPYYQSSIVLGAKNLYTGLISSPLALGGLLGANFTLNEKWELRFEGSYLTPPPWIKDQSVRGRAINVGVAFANRR